jgi:hypothetical protein
VLDQAVDQTYPANTRCLTTHDDMMQDRIEQYLVNHGFDHTSLVKQFSIEHCPDELTMKQFFQSEELLRDLTLID